jgi:hypothetical protein
MSSVKAGGDSVRYNYETINALVGELGRPVHTLLALTPQVDPFYAGVPASAQQAEWFREVWDRSGFTTGVHIRRIHYRCVSGDPPVTFWDGKPYLNTSECYAKLMAAGRAARHLRLVSPGAFEDHKNPDPILTETVEESDAEISFDDDEEMEIPTLSTKLPELPRLTLLGPKIRQRYMVEVWCEKSTINDVLLPLMSEYGINVVTSAGDMSLTRCHELVDRVLNDGRPCRILYISDFDPKGYKMPVGAARKIEHRLRLEDLDLDIQVHPIALTEAQCIEYRLPRIPTKEGDRCAAGFEERFGEGQTELDAMEALHPGELGRIVSREIERFYDDDLATSVEEDENDVENTLGSVTDDVHDRYSDELSVLRTEYAEMAHRFNAEVHNIRERFDSLCNRIKLDLTNAAPYLDEYEWPEPAEGDEYDDPLFDSSRDYVEQIDKYKAYDGKPTTGAVSSKATSAARTAKIMPVIREIQASGVTSLNGIATELNKRGLTAPAGGPWCASQIKRTLARAA